jgi:hypothetical protein
MRESYGGKDVGVVLKPCGLAGGHSEDGYSMFHWKVILYLQSTLPHIPEEQLRQKNFLLEEQGWKNFDFCQFLKSGTGAHENIYNGTFPPTTRHI